MGFSISLKNSETSPKHAKSWASPGTLFYRYQESVEIDGVDQLDNHSKRGTNVKNRIDLVIEEAVKMLTLDKPAWGQVRASNELRRQGFSISPAGVRCVRMRHDLENINKRLKALDIKVASEGTALTEDQHVIFERRKAENETHGEIKILFM